MTACEWVKWCRRDGEHLLELSNRAGSERITVCRLHLRPAQLHGYLVIEGPDGAEGVDDHYDVPPGTS